MSNSIEYIHDIIWEFHYNDENLDNPGTKSDVLNVIRFLLELEIIFVFRCEKNLSLKLDNINIGSIIDFIDDKWKLGSKYPEFYPIIMFGTRKWYVDNYGA